MGQLLSERMQQKNGKLVVKREVRVKPEKIFEPVPIYSSNNVFDNPVVLNKRQNKSAKRVIKEELSDDSDYTFTPAKRNRHELFTIQSSSTFTDDQSRRKRRSTRVSQASPDLVDPEEPSSEAVVIPKTPTPITPEASKLKGVIWPGMDLFDAASFEARRKRNQKKDGSVLKRMEKTSELIEPYEIIYSSGGTRIKERFIDGNVDSSSPLQGETPVPKSKLPKKRQPLAAVSGNVPRKVQGNAKKPQAKTMAEVRSRAKPSKLSQAYAPSSSVEDLLESTSRFDPTTDESQDFKMAVGNLGEKRGPSFTIYRDEDAQNSSMPRLGAQNPFNAVPNQIYPARPQLSFITAPWLQPQNQYPQHTQYSNPFLAYTGDGMAYPEFQQHRPNPVKQESPTGAAYRPAFSPTRPEWTYRGVPNHSPFPVAMQSNYNFFGGFAGHEDPLGYAKNPLSSTFDQVGPLLNTSMTSNSNSIRTPSPIKKKQVSLDGTTSDVEDQKNYEQALFATSE